MNSPGIVISNQSKNILKMLAN